MIYRGFELTHVAPPIGTRAFDWAFNEIGDYESGCFAAVSEADAKSQIDEILLEKEMP